MVGRSVEVLLERTGRHPGQLAGKTPYMQAVQIETATHRIGDRVLVAIERAGSNSLFGRAVEQPELADVDDDEIMNAMFPEKDGDDA